MYECDYYFDGTTDLEHSIVYYNTTCDEAGGYAQTKNRISKYAQKKFPSLAQNKNKSKAKQHEEEDAAATEDTFCPIAT